MALKNRPGKSNLDPETASKEIDAILAASPKEHRVALQKIREAIRKTVPDAVEGISYSIPAFRYKGKPLAGYASLKNHCSYFPMSGKLTTKFKKELKDFKTSKGGIQFQPDHPLPVDLIKKLLQARIKEIENA
jgi:uncharacterized protein YdhG (YjbR/CyaY superfamily)